MLEAEEEALDPLLQWQKATIYYKGRRKTRGGTNVYEHLTFFANKFFRGSALVVIKLPRVRVSHSRQVNAVLVVLIVVWLVGRPRQDILRSSAKSGTNWDAALIVTVSTYSKKWEYGGMGDIPCGCATYCIWSISVHKLVFNIDVIQTHPGFTWHVSCKEKKNTSKYVNKHCANPLRPQTAKCYLFKCTIAQT